MAYISKDSSGVNQEAAARLFLILSTFHWLELWHKPVNWSWAPNQCQQESPVWGVVKKETVFSAKQLDYDTARLGNGSIVKQQGCEAALGPGCFLATRLCSAASPAEVVLILGGKGKCTS